MTQRDVMAVVFLLALETACRQGGLFKLDWQDGFLKGEFFEAS